MGPIAWVEVSSDGGRAWTGAALEPAAGRFGWSRWTFEWTAEPGEHLALVKGNFAKGGPVLVRVHALNVLGDVLGIGGHAACVRNDASNLDYRAVCRAGALLLQYRADIA